MDKREEHPDRDVCWHIAKRPGKRRALGTSVLDRLTQRNERAKASLRAKVKHPFRVIKCQFGFRKVRLRGLAKNSMQLKMLCTLSNIWMARRHLLATAG